MDRGQVKRGRTFPPPKGAGRPDFNYKPRLLSPIPPSPSDRSSTLNEMKTSKLDMPMVLGEAGTVSPYILNIPSEIPILISPGLQHMSRGQSIASSTLSGTAAWQGPEEASPLSIDQSSDSDISDSNGDYLVREACLSRVSYATPQIMLQHQRGRLLLAGGDWPLSDEKHRSCSFSQVSRKKNVPSPLNLHAIKEAEARGSLTSLPDLIQRAARLANYLEAGVTVSEEPVNTFDTKPSRLTRPSLSPHGIYANEIGTRMNLSDILEAFPVASEVKTKESDSRPNSFIPYSHHQTIEKPRACRKVCGISLPIFIYIVTFLVFMLSAGVVVMGLKKTATGSQSAFCFKMLKCMNGGKPMISEGRCICVCVSSFAGSLCELSADPSCSVVNIGSKNVTIGSAIPPLAAISNQTFGIYLDAWELNEKLGGVSCKDQNELVRINGSTTSQWEMPKSVIDKDEGYQVIDSTAKTIGELPSSLREKSSVFSRITVLYLAENYGLGIARTAKQQLQQNFDLGSQASTSLTIDDFIVNLTEGTIRNSN